MMIFRELEKVPAHQAHDQRTNRKKMAAGVLKITFSAHQHNFRAPVSHYIFPEEKPSPDPRTSD